MKEELPKYKAKHAGVEHKVKHTFKPSKQSSWIPLYFSRTRVNFSCSCFEHDSGAPNQRVSLTAGLIAIYSSYILYLSIHLFWSTLQEAFKQVAIMWRNSPNNPKRSQ